MRLNDLTLNESFNKGGYCCVKPSEEVANEIYNWVTKTCKFHDNIDPANEYHATLIYDKRNKQFDISEPKEEYIASVSGADLFGEEKNVLVLLLDSEDLQNRNKELIDAGYESTYPKYKPHITIKKESNQNELKTVEKNLKDLNSIIGNISLTNENWAMVED